MAALLARAAESIALIAAYEDKGCAAHIQKALNTPSPESEEAAFQAVAACVVSIQKFYQVRNRDEMRWGVFFIVFAGARAISVLE